jgi:metal-responsive CopG/Arc/MetJ family transcriptional regulator
VSLDEDLVNKIDEAKGITARSAVVNFILKKYFEMDNDEE